MESKLAEAVRAERLARYQQMTPEERLLAFVHHSDLMAQLHQVGIAFRHRAASPVKRTGIQRGS